MVDKRKKKKIPSSGQTVSTVRGRYVHHFSHSRVDEQGHLCTDPLSYVVSCRGSDIRGSSILDCGVAANQPGELPLADLGSTPMRMAPMNHTFLCMDATGSSVGVQMIQFPTLYLSNGDRTFSPASDCGNASHADYMPSSTNISSTNNVSSKSYIPANVSYIDLGDCT